MGFVVDFLESLNEEKDKLGIQIVPRGACDEHEDPRKKVSVGYYLFHSLISFPSAFFVGAQSVTLLTGLTLASTPLGTPAIVMLAACGIFLAGAVAGYTLGHLACESLRASFIDAKKETNPLKRAAKTLAKAPYMPLIVLSRALNKTISNRFNKSAARSGLQPEDSAAAARRRLHLDV